MRTLRERIAQQYGAPFDAIFDSPDARAELGEVDRAQAIMLLIGPLVVGRISTLADFDYRECARKAVDGFLAVHRKPGAQGESATGLEQNQPRGWAESATGLKPTSGPQIRPGRLRLSAVTHLLPGYERLRRLGGCLTG